MLGHDYIWGSGGVSMTEQHYFCEFHLAQKACQIQGRRPLKRSIESRTKDSWVVLCKMDIQVHFALSQLRQVCLVYENRKRISSRAGRMAKSYARTS